jgi:hypothetical protein
MNKGALKTKGVRTMNIEKGFRWVVMGLAISLGLLLGIDSALAAVEAKQSMQVYQPDADTLENYEALKEMEARWELALKAGGWVRHRYLHRTINNDTSYRSPDAQFPSEGKVEIWFHFNNDALVDQQITFISHGTQKYMTEILYRGIYRSMAETFTPLEEKPYSPSLYFYLTRESPDAAAKEGVQININRSITLLGAENVERFTIRRGFPSGVAGYSDKDPDITGYMHVIYVDPTTAQPLQIENYFLLKDGRSRLYQEITQIEAERLSSLPEDVQWYFDNYDQLDWSSYIK